MELAVLDPYTTNPGPIDGSILYDQDKHVSTAVWDGQERGALRCHEHTSKLDQWALTAKQIELVDKAGFGYLRSIPAISLDNPLISALVERWRRETNTFHLNVGEMTVTLKDVALLLGRAPEHGYTSGGMVKLSWLKEFFSCCPEDASIEVIEQHTRAYLLYLVGSTIFSTTTGNKVPVMYLPLFENFERCGNYAWGAAALAFLYRALGNASLKTQSTISGCLTLLQCWCYFHLNMGRPKLNHDPLHDRFPFVLRWKGKQSGPTANRDVVFYRKALDSLKPCDVEWLPYRNMDSMVIPEDIKSTLILGRSKTMLICFDKAERHLPNRCLRQYGMLQSIPEDVEHWERKSRGVDGGVDLSGKMESELNEWSDRRLHIVEGDEGVDECEYMQWYLKITRKFVGRPISLSTEFQRTNAGLRDIAHIADTFSTKGLDPQQVESISRIRYIAHECLRDQVGGPAIVSATPQVELGKRVRGKERVRRKGTAKRLRKDDTDLSNLDREVDHTQICHVDGEVNHVQLIHASGDGETMQLCDANFEVDQSELGYIADMKNNEELNHPPGEENNVKLNYAAGQENDEELNHATGWENDEELNNATGRENEELNNAAGEEDNEELNHAGGEESEELNHAVNKSPGENNSEKLGDGAMKVDNAELSDKPSEVDNSQIGDVKNEVNDSNLSGATLGVDNSQLSDMTEQVNNSQLSDAAANVNDQHSCHVNTNTENEAPVAKTALEGVQNSSLENHEDITQKGGCSVAV
ncbi:serine/threonine-protein phosphatase 7 long form-like [Quillaja saponaria]|uniref:Serine/threonine-protein phosphatase 7 long form-like n=1 Tax=Quillaja saponaria TaxID=32244 RepID=A0AAD7PM66_QUISA|nr:serine/threonine-protein phosphatase 7 long form-like [Quillaja saponaria]